VLRFWETKFTFIKPVKRAGGRRFYRPSDISVLAAVRRLLHQEGYTIKGVQKLYLETGLRRFTGDPAQATESLVNVRPPDLDSHSRARMEAALAELEAARSRLDKLLGRA
jgi:DNA-binding transcriptional MerR regulator